ncbi:MAG TPA: hypothetical protein VJZ04_01640 [Lachnospiraceae bacterium]|nr:hypothetical protein [Lachnospiraceae bacterium]
MNNHRIIPFYMTYPLPIYYEQEDTVMKDLEYLQQMYPTEAKKYQKRIVTILDKLDYEGSIIYDEFPDRIMINKMGKDILAIIQKEEEKMEDAIIATQKWEGLDDMIQILLFYEIYKRRHNKHRGILKF